MRLSSNHMEKPVSPLQGPPCTSYVCNPLGLWAVASVLSKFLSVSQGFLPNIQESVTRRCSCKHSTCLHSQDETNVGVGTSHEGQILDQRKQLSLLFPHVSSVCWAFRRSGSGLVMHPQLCLESHFIARQLTGRQLGNCLPWLKTSGRWFMKDVRLARGRGRLAPRSRELEVVVSYTVESGSRVGEGCRRARVGTWPFAGT